MPEGVPFPGPTGDWVDADGNPCVIAGQTPPPAPVQPAPVHPAPAEPAPAQPAPAEPAPAQPAPTEPAPTEPTQPATQPAPPQPAPTQPAPTRPAPSQPDPTKPLPLAPVPPESGTPAATPPVTTPPVTTPPVTPPVVTPPGAPADPDDAAGSDPGDDGEPDPDEEPAVPSPAPAPSPAPGKPLLSKPGGHITRTEVITRSVSWVVQKVPYSQTRWWSDENGKYRQDCSGMVSMAWHLSQKTNYWTGNLAKVSHRIPSKSLEPGDILLRPRQHTLIFAGWANEKKTKFNLYEEYARGKPARYATGASLASYLDRGFGAYRYKNILDDPIKLPKLLTGANGKSDAIETAAASFDLPGVESVPWTPESAVYISESDEPAAEEGASTPDAVPDVPVDTLVATQKALDDAVLAAGRLATEAQSSTGTYLVVAGLGLTFLTFPLAVAMRAGAWSPNAAPRRRPE